MKLFRTLFVASSALVLSAASLSAQQATAQVTCKDGSMSKGGRGACSSHGGIAVTAAKTDTKVAKTAAKAEADIAKTAAKADAKIEKTADKADAKMDKADAKATTKVAKHSKKKAKAKA